MFSAETKYLQWLKKNRNIFDKLKIIKNEGMSGFRRDTFFWGVGATGGGVEPP